MNKSNQKDDSSDVFDQQEEQVAGDLQQSFMSTCQNLKQSHKNSLSHELQIPKPIQLMFILFSYYQEDLIQIGFENNCKVKISLNKIKIISDIQKKDVENCHEVLKKYLQKIFYIQFKHQNSYKIFCSPYFNKKAEEKGFRLCKFNNKIYCHAKQNGNKMSQKNLEIAVKDIFSGQYIFTVDIKSRKSKERQIYSHLRHFVKIMMKHLSKEFRDREVVVQLDTSEIKINCIGSKQRDLVAVKNTLKNLLQSIVILIVNLQSQQIEKKVADLKKYIQKNSDYPIYVSRLTKKTLTIISKQNVVRKLIGRQKVSQIIQLNGNTELGLFLPRRYNYVERKLMIQQICTKKGYDFTTLGGIYHYFKKMFIHEGQQVDQKQLLQLLTQILNAIKQNKDKFQIPQKFLSIKKQYRDIQVNEGEYYCTGQIKRDEDLSRILRSDVMVQRLKMSKPALVKFKVCESQQSEKLYWFIDKQQKKILCKVQEMIPGIQYFSGRLKMLRNQPIYSFQTKIWII